MRTTTQAMVPCDGCGALVADCDGPTHPYISATAGCWRVYGDVLAREFGEFAYPKCHRQTVDAYAAQHPGMASRRAIQSVAVHLIALHLALERGCPSAQVVARMRTILRRAQPFHWLEPPSFAGAETICDVARAGSLAEHERAVQLWAESVWAAWRPHHATVRRWMEREEHA